MRWFPAGHPVMELTNRNVKAEYRRMDSAARFVAREKIDLLVIEEMRDLETCRRLVGQPALEGWSVDVCSAFPKKPDAEVPPHQNAIISRYKPIDSGWKEWDGEDEKRPPRGYVWAVYDFASNITAVVGVHLKSNYVPEDDPDPKTAPMRNRAMREESARQLVTLMEKLSEKKYGGREISVFVVTGDFNTSILEKNRFRGEQTIEILKKAGFKDCFEGVVDRMTLPKTQQYEATCFDYLFLRGNVEYFAPTVSQKQYVSDHQMISVSLFYSNNKETKEDKP